MFYKGINLIELCDSESLPEGFSREEIRLADLFLVINNSELFNDLEGLISLYKDKTFEEQDKAFYNSFITKSEGVLNKHGFKSSDGLPIHCLPGTPGTDQYRLLGIENEKEPLGSLIPYKDGKVVFTKFLD